MSLIGKFKSFEVEFLHQLKLKLRRQEIEFDVRFLDRSNEAVKIFTDEANRTIVIDYTVTIQIS